MRRAPYRLEESIPSEPRLMLVLNGSADYQIDDITCRLTKGHMIFMPAWVRRTWIVSPKPGFTSLAWCRFLSTESELKDLTVPIIHKVADLDLEKSSFERLEKLRADQNPSATLEAEGELKAVLARFLGHAPAGILTRKKSLSCGEHGIEASLEYLRSHFTEPKALRKVAGIAGLHPKYFRVLFRKYTGLTPSGYLMQLRMRAARYYQHESSLRVKEVASAVGYDDPFYFSRLYRKYWGHAPTDDRRSVRVGVSADLPDPAAVKKAAAGDGPPSPARRTSK